MQGRRSNSLWVIIGCLLSSIGAFSQQINVNGGFVEDSLLIGDDVHFYVTATYPAHLEMVFPDSTFNFTPFEYSGKQFFPTEIIDSLAYDSTVYTIQSFEIDPIQYLHLPVFVLKGADTLKRSTPRDSVFLTELAPIVTDSTRLIANANYHVVDTRFNYPLLWIVLGVSIVVVLVVLLIFGKKIIRHVKLKRLRREHERFIEELTSFIGKLKREGTPSIAEHALSSWKKYQEKLEKTPFSTYTTKDILAKEFTQELERPLRSIDRVVYGKMKSETVFQDFQQIEDFVQHRYLKKVEEISSPT